MQFHPDLRNPSQRRHRDPAAECQMPIYALGGGKLGPALARCCPQALRSQSDGTESEDVVAAVELCGYLLTHLLEMKMSASVHLLRRPSTSKLNAPGKACVTHACGLACKTDLNSMLVSDCPSGSTDSCFPGLMFVYSGSACATLALPNAVCACSRAADVDVDVFGDCSSSAAFDPLSLASFGSRRPPSLPAALQVGQFALATVNRC